MDDLKNLNCLLPKTKSLLLKMIKDCTFLDKYVLVGGSLFVFKGKYKVVLINYPKKEERNIFSKTDNL